MFFVCFDPKWAQQNHTYFVVGRKTPPEDIRIWGFPFDPPKPEGFHWGPYWAYVVSNKEHVSEVREAHINGCQGTAEPITIERLNEIAEKFKVSAR